MAGGGFNGHTSQPSAFTSSQKDMKYVSPLALDHTALGDVSGKHLSCPWHCSPTPVNAIQQGVHHMHVQLVQDVAFVQRRVNAMPVCSPVATVIFVLLSTEIN